MKLISQKIPTVQAIYLFGSMNTGFANAESDVDLAVLAEQKLDAVLLWQVSQEIASLLHKEFD